MLATGPRVDLELPENATFDDYQDLGGFVRYCIDRIERDARPVPLWTVKIAHGDTCYSAEVAVELEGVVVSATATAFDRVVACWDAFRRIEPLVQVR